MLSGCAHPPRAQTPAVAKALLPSAKVIVAVCDPITRLWSQYNHAKRFNFVEPTYSFADLVVEALEASRGNATTRLLLIHRTFVENGRYALPLLDWYAAFGRDNVHVIDTDLTKDDGPARVLAERALLNFVELNPEREDWANVKPAFVNTMIGCACRARVRARVARGGAAGCGGQPPLRAPEAPPLAVSLQMNVAVCRRRCAPRCSRCIVSTTRCFEC